MNYEPVDGKIAVGMFVAVTPKKHRGKAGIEAITRSDRTRRLVFWFQRQKFEVLKENEILKDERGIEEKIGASEERDDDDDLIVGDGRNNGAIRPVAFPNKLPTNEYLDANGLSFSGASEGIEHFGRNVLSIKLPNFIELMQVQLLSPIAVFQLFTAALWLLDAYWQYTAFTLVSILMLESGTVYQKTKTLQTLDNMCSKPYPIYVFRNRRWNKISTEDLVPGDIISMNPKSPNGSEDEPAEPKPSQPSAKSPPIAARPTEVIPVDCVIVRGGAVVNESTLTGESIPQMKDMLKRETSAGSNDRTLNIEGDDRIHTLFSGTSLISVNPGPKVATEGKVGIESIPEAPNRGCLCYVLRTGFGSSQGSLVQMIEFSTQSVSADSTDTLYALLLLLFFAIVAAGYVLKKGLEKGDRTTHELLLKCVIILTSVVPRQLPVQMAFAVNQALMQLNKVGVFCTEPFRVPDAGKITHCLFDKTGTLTTDQMVPVGVISKKSCKISDSNFVKAVKTEMTLCSEAEPLISMILASCHSLVAVEGSGVVGDPIEIAGVKGVGWKYDAVKEVCSPGDWEAEQKAADNAKKELETLKDNQGARIPIEERLKVLENKIQLSQQKAKDSPVRQTRIIRRHHFASKLQRMSVVAQINGKSDFVAGSHACLVKGSAEALLPLMKPESLPPWYEGMHMTMAEQGMRVLALAYKWIDGSTEALRQLPRQDVETDLRFAGFIAFACKTRGDSGTVIKSLMSSDHACSMLTGDAPLTALHVARQVGMCEKDAFALQLSLKGSRGSGVLWTPVGEKAIQKYGPGVTVPFNVSRIRSLRSSSHVLVTTEDALDEAVETSESSIWKEIDCISVFARMKPQGKARVIRALQDGHNAHVLMCGDGGNDVGALKQADVGLALLSGYGDVNTSNVSDDQNDSDKKAEEKLNAEDKLMAVRAREANKRVAALLGVKQKELQAKMQTEWLKEELEARKARGESYEGFMANIGAMKALAFRLNREMAQERQRLQKIHGNVFDNKGADSAANAATKLEEAGSSGAPMIRPGDASIAAPFTSRAPSVRSVVSLIRQGRCTLLGALQQQQIMMLECMISAYTLAALSLEGARSSERQMMASNWLIMIAGLAFSYSAPVKEMHPIRPLRSLFHPAIFFSTLGQAAIHLFCMIYSVHLATSTMGEDKLAEVKEFNRKVRAGENVAPVAGEEEPDMMAQMMSLWAAPFMPNLMNSVIFLVETAQIIAVLFVNYKGRPWMIGMTENHPLFLSIFACIGGVAACAWQLSPELNSMIHLHPFPDDDFRYKVMSMVLLSIGGTFLWDRLCTAIFAPNIFKSMLNELFKTGLSDILPMFKSLGKVFVGLMLLGSGNILVWGGCYWLYRKYSANKEAQEAAELGVTR